MNQKIKFIGINLIISIILMIIIPITSNATTVNQDVVFTLSSEATELIQGEQIIITLSVDLKNDVKINSFIGNLKFDSSILSIAKDEYNSEIIETVSSNKWNEIDCYYRDDGYYKLIGTRSYNSANKSGAICNITFDVLQNADSAKITFSGSEEENGLIDCAYADENDEINISSKSTYVNIPPKDELYLESEKYKIGENDIDIYEQNDIYIDKILPETTVEDFEQNCDTNGTIKIIDVSGNEVSDTELIGTNMKIQVTKDNEEISLTLVVMGDLDGNGKVTATDLSALNQAILKVIELKDAWFVAADLDNNGNLTATDLSTINNTILKNIVLTYTKL